MAWAPTKTHMARPRRLKQPVKINLMIDKHIKNHATKMARKQGISVGRLFENWVLQDLNGSQADNEEEDYDDLASES